MRSGLIPKQSVWVSGKRSPNPETGRHRPTHRNPLCKSQREPTGGSEPPPAGKLELPLQSLELLLRAPCAALLCAGVAQPRWEAEGTRSTNPVWNAWSRWEGCAGAKSHGEVRGEEGRGKPLSPISVGGVSSLSQSRIFPRVTLLASGGFPTPTAPLWVCGLCHCLCPAGGDGGRDIHCSCWIAAGAFPSCDRGWVNPVRTPSSGRRGQALQRSAPRRTGNAGFCCLLQASPGHCQGASPAPSRVPGTGLGTHSSFCSSAPESPRPRRDTDSHSVVRAEFIARVEMKGEGAALWRCTVPLTHTQQCTVLLGHARHCSVPSWHAPPNHV